MIDKRGDVTDGVTPPASDPPVKKSCCGGRCQKKATPQELDNDVTRRLADRATAALRPPSEKS